jgi:hypothetical protein
MKVLDLTISLKEGITGNYIRRSIIGIFVFLIAEFGLILDSHIKRYSSLLFSASGAVSS